MTPGIAPDGESSQRAKKRPTRKEAACDHLGWMYMSRGSQGCVSSLRHSAVIVPLLLRRMRSCTAVDKLCPLKFMTEKIGKPRP